MKVHIKYYAKYREYTGTREEDADIDASTTSELVKFLTARYPKMKNDRNILIAVNNKFVRDNETIRDGDAISVFPPVSGG